MRLIPKKTRLNATIWKGFTLLDIGLAFILLAVAFLLVLSNLTFKWYALIVLVPFCVVLFFSSDDERAYTQLVYLVRYAVSRKRYDKTKKHKKNIDMLIPQLALEPDGLMNYGEYYGKAISLDSIEYRLLNEWTQNQKISQFANLLNALTSEQRMQLVKIDRPINFDEIAGNLYDKLEIAKVQSENVCKNIILNSRLRQIDALNNIDKQYRPYYYIVLYDTDKGSLNNLCDFALNILTEIGLSPKLTSDKETALFLKYCYKRNFDERDIDDVLPQDYLDYIKPQSITFTATGSKIDEVQSFTYAIADYPLAVSNAWGAAIFNMDNTKVVLNIKPLPKDKAVKRVDNTVTEIGTRENTNKASEVISQDTHIETMGALLNSLQNGNESLFDCSLSVTGFFNNGDADEQKGYTAFRKNIRRNMQISGFKVSALRCRQFDGYVSSAVSRRTSLRSLERGINSESLAAVFPFVFTSVIENDGITLGNNKYPVIFDLWKRSEKYINSNAFIIGKSGSGKSYFAKTLLSLLYSDDVKIFVLDPENEYNILCKNLEGSFIDVGNATTGRLNPFHIYQILTDDGEQAAPEVVYSSHLRFLESFFQLTLPGIHSDTLEELNNLVVKCYESCGIVQETDCKKFKPECYPTFDKLKALVEEELSLETVIMRKNNLQRAHSYITKFATGGRYANLWNGASTLSSSEKFTVFNFQSLLESKNYTVSNGQMLLVMRYLEQQLINIREVNRNSKKVTHTIIGIDEGYNFVDIKYPISLDFVFQWYKRVRKYDGGMLFATQNLSDITGNAEVINKTSAIINNSQYSFILPLAPADIEVLTELYRNAGEINDTEQNEIANNERGSVFLISAPRERTSFKVIAAEDVQSLFEKDLFKSNIV